MKAAVIALVLCASMGACQYVKYPHAGPNAGNPDHDAYAGSRGSTYDMAANPPRDLGTVTYNPNAPMAPMPDPGLAGSPVQSAPLAAPRR